MAAALVALGCAGETGTISVAVVTAPGRDLSAVERLEVHIDDAVFSAARAADGTLTVAAEFPARAGSRIKVAGYGGGGELLVVGQSGPVPLRAVDAAISIYLAPPLSIGAAPMTMPARAEVAAVANDSGVLVAGGLNAAGAPTKDVRFYGAYTHEFAEVTDLPEARSGTTALVGDSGYFYLFGGANAAGDDTATMWQMEPRLGRSAVYSSAELDPAYARSGKSGLSLGGETFVIDGDPVLEVNGLSAGPFDDSLDKLRDAMLHGGPLAALLPDGVVTVTGTSAFVHRGDSSTEMPEFLQVPRIAPAVAATATYLVVAGGRDELGAPIGSAEIFDASTLERIATLDMVVARSGAVALPLSTDQILIVGGRDKDGLPIGTAELFTPPL